MAPLGQDAKQELEVRGQRHPAAVVAVEPEGVDGDIAEAEGHAQGREEEGQGARVRREAAAAAAWRHLLPLFLQEITNINGYTTFSRDVNQLCTVTLSTC